MALAVTEVLREGWRVGQNRWKLVVSERVMIVCFMNARASLEIWRVKWHHLIMQQWSGRCRRGEIWTGSGDSGKSVGVHVQSDWCTPS